MNIGFTDYIRKVVSFDTRSLWRCLDFELFWYFVHRKVASKIVYMMVSCSRQCRRIVYSILRSKHFLYWYNFTDIRQKRL